MGLLFLEYMGVCFVQKGMSDVKNDALSINNRAMNQIS